MHMKVKSFHKIICTHVVNETHISLCMFIWRGQSKLLELKSNPFDLFNEICLNHHYVIKYFNTYETNAGLEQILHYSFDD